MKIVILGDSITSGYDSLSGTSSPILKKKIEQIAQQKSFDLEVNLQGKNGETTQDALKRVQPVLDAQADKVLIFFGANDSAKHRNVSPQQFLTNLSNLTDQIGSQKVVLLTPPWHNDHYDRLRRSNQFLLEYRTQTLAVADQFQLPVIDVFRQMEIAQPETWLQNDGLHFSETGYERLADLIVQSLMKM